MALSRRELQLRSRDGTHLHAQVWAPSGSVRAELLIVHGYFEHGARYRELAETLAAAGIASLAIDLRGHGHSTGQRGFVRRFVDYHDDVGAALNTLTAKHRFILGHSMGGLLVLDFVAKYPQVHNLAGLIISSPYLALAAPVPTSKRWLGNIAGLLWPTLAVPGGLDASWTSHDQTMVNAYRHDPLVFTKATAGWYRESTRAQQRVCAIRHISTPLLLCYGGADPIAAPEVTAAFAAAVSSPDKTIRPYANGFHEILNETFRRELHMQVRDWIVAHLDS